MKVQEIFEARRNPHLNPKSDIVADFYYLYHKYKDDLYLSFTQLNKIGVNPNSRFDTPSGVYAYPAWFVKETLEEQNEYNISLMPFAGDTSRYAQFLCARGRRLELKHYDDGDLDDDIDKLCEYFFNTSLDPDFYHELEDTLNSNSRFTSREAPYLLWTMIYLFSDKSRKSINVIENIESMLQGSDSQNDIEYRPLKGIKTSINFNIILNKILGYDSVIDDGLGIIHHLEPEQAVFLTPKAYRQVGVWDLKTSHARDTGERYQSMDED